MKLRVVVEFEPAGPMRLLDLKQIIGDIAGSRPDVLTPVFLSVEQVDDKAPARRTGRDQGRKR